MSFLNEYLAKNQYKKAFRKERCLNKEALFSDLKQLLILYPEQQQFHQEADNVLQLLFSAFPKSEYSMLKLSDIPKDELAFSKLPKENFFEIYQSKDIDLLIDLSPKFSEKCSFLVSQIEASLKVALFQNPRVEQVYDLFFSVKVDSLDRKVKHFLKDFSALRLANSAIREN